MIAIKSYKICPKCGNKQTINNFINIYCNNCIFPNHTNNSTKYCMWCNQHLPIINFKPLPSYIVKTLDPDDKIDNEDYFCSKCRKECETYKRNIKRRINNKW